MGKFIIVVDDAVDPSNLEAVLATVCMRWDKERFIDIVRGYQNSPLDPFLSPDKRKRGEITEAKMLIDACMSYHWRDKFPKSAKASYRLTKAALEKFPEVFK